MEELKLLVEAIADLPTLAAWVLVAYLLYKLAIVGSIYGVIRFFISKVYEINKLKQERLKEQASKEAIIMDVLSGVKFTQDGREEINRRLTRLFKDENYVSAYRVQNILGDLGK